MSNVALQLSLSNNGSLATNGNVPFNNQLYSSGDISYDTGTATITFNQTGRYVVQWWAAIQTTTSSNQLAFALNYNGTPLPQGCSPLKADQVSGTTILEVATVPSTMTLQGASAAEVFFSTAVPVKAGLTVVQDDDVDAAVYGGLYTDETFISIDLPGDAQLIPVPLGGQMPSSGVTYGTNSITIEQAGTYRLDYTLIASTGTQEFSTTIAANGLSVITIEQAHVLSSTSQLNISAFTFAQLNAGDVLTLIVRAGVAFTLTLGTAGAGAMGVTRVGP